MSGLRIPAGVLACGLALYLLVLNPFTVYMGGKPIEEKLGYLPSIKLLKPLSADLKELTAASMVFKVLMYYGGLLNKAQAGHLFSEPPDLRGMSRLLHGAVQLDPYNMDAYYFAQSFLTWDAHQFKVANDLLEYGMRYRTWDWYLPFFAGFNHAFFMKDYAKASEYYKKAGVLSGNVLHISLAGRYMQESGQTELAIAYLSGMVKTAKDETIKKTYLVRLQAFQEVRRIELARDRYRAEHGGQAGSVELLVQSGYLQPAPTDPYGGKFYLEPSGKVGTTSKFAFAPTKK